MSPIPLDLVAEVTASNGTKYRWGPNEPPGSRPQNFSFRTKIGEGFSDASLQLPRRIDSDYADLNLVDTVTFIGADGTVAYEGRNSAMPRDLSDQHSIGVTLAGWMAHTKDRRFQEIYADRLPGNWTSTMPLNERIRLANAGTPVDFGSFSWASGQGGLVCALPNQAFGAQVQSSVWYVAPRGCQVSAVDYVGSRVSWPAGWIAAAIRTSDVDNMGSGVATLTTLDNTLRSATLTPGRYAAIIAYSNGTASTPAAGASETWTKIGVYGNSGVPRHTGQSGEPAGVFAGEVMRDIAGRFCPMLDTSGVQDTDYVIQHLVFDRTFPYDAFLELNKYHLWNLAVWENKRLVFEPYDLTDYDWEIRTDDQGTTFSPNGPSIESLVNGMSVLYTDPLTGVPDVLEPGTYPELLDVNADNPWNAWGIPRYDDITLSSPTITASALALGQAALADRNRPKTPGTITVRGYIRDRAGNEQPVWKIRAGQTISVTNFPNDEPRLIIETDYNDADKSVRLAIDKPFALLDAYLDRQSNALQAAGLS